MDTNVVAYQLLETPLFAEECGAFWRQAGETWAPASWRPELLNVLWLAVRHDVVSLDDAQALVRLSEGLVSVSVSVKEVQSAALALAVAEDHPAYDTLFVALAMREGVPLITYDKRLLDRFPQVARRPAQIGEGGG